MKGLGRSWFDWVRSVVAFINRRISKLGKRFLLWVLTLVLLPGTALIWLQAPPTEQIFRVAILILAAIWAFTAYVSFRNSKTGVSEWLARYGAEISPEFFGALLTTVLFTFFVGNIQQNQFEAQLKSGLLNELRSSKNEYVQQTLRELRRHGWLTDGSLSYLHLGDTSFENTDLVGVNLQGTDFFLANLQGADLRDANLEGTNFTAANLRGANLSRANLHWAILDHADLSEACLRGANLTGAHMSGAILPLDLSEDFYTTARRGVCVWDGNAYVIPTSVIGLRTVLPDGRSWYSGIDLGRFTDPEHPEFWEPEDNPYPRG